MSTHALHDANAESSDTHAVAVALRRGSGLPARSVDDPVAGPLVVVDSRFGELAIRPDLTTGVVVVRRTDTTDWVLRTDGTVHGTASTVAGSVPELSQAGDLRVWLVAHHVDDPAMPAVVWAGMDHVPGQPCHHCITDGLPDPRNCPGLWVHMRQAAAIYQHRPAELVFGAFPVTQTVPPGGEIPVTLLRDVIRHPAALVRDGQLTIA